MAAATETHAPQPELPSWPQPTVECFETRPEVTSYAGVVAPWNPR